MTEPKEVAPGLEEVAPGIFHWRISNSLIGGGISSSHALLDAEGAVLVDPVPLEPGALAQLGGVSAILLTAACHQRSAWRYRRELGGRVYLPDGSRETEEEPDETYAAGARLPGGLQAIHTPGPERPHYSLWLERDPGVLFCSDLVMRYDGGLQFVPPAYHEDPAETRRSVERLLDLPFSILCLAHGAPITDDPHGAIRRLLDAAPAA